MISRLLNIEYLRDSGRRYPINDQVRHFSSLGGIPINHKFDIFLSHSYLDKDVISGIYHLLMKFNLDVYVDWIIDPDLDRNNVTRKSAERIRKRMDNSRSLIYAISISAHMSKWMPWELGYIDGSTDHKCAILPISEGYDSSFKRQEYLELYPIVIQSEITEGLFVKDCDFVNTEIYNSIPIIKWINNNSNIL